jgi:K+-sensing histidine kinase KdpD
VRVTADEPGAELVQNSAVGQTSGLPATDPGPANLRGGPRRWLGATVGLAGLLLVTVALLPLRDRMSLAGVTLLYLIPVLGAAVAGGAWPALVGAVTADLLLNFFFVEPYHTFSVSRSGNIVVLVVYILVAATVAVAVDTAARQHAAAVRRGVEAGLLARLSAAPIAADSLTVLLEQIRDAYGMVAVALLEGERVVAEVGERPDSRPVLTIATADGQRLATWGVEVFAEDRGRTSGSPTRPRRHGSWPRSTGHGRLCWTPWGMICVPRWPRPRRRSRVCSRPTSTGTRRTVQSY